MLKPPVVTGLVIVAYVAFLGWDAYVSNPDCRFTFGRYETVEFGQVVGNQGDCYKPGGYLEELGVHTEEHSIVDAFSMTAEAMAIFALAAISSIWAGLGLAKLWQMRSGSYTSSFGRRVSSRKVMAVVWGGAAALGIMVVFIPVAYGEIKGSTSTAPDYTPAPVEQLELELMGRWLSSARSTPDVFVQGNHAFVAAWRNGLRVVDISNPSCPREVGFLDTLGMVGDVFVQGSHAFVGVSNFSPSPAVGLRVVDVSNPISPKEVGSLVTPGSVTDIFVRDNLAFLALGLWGLLVVDVSNPASPKEVGSLDTLRNIPDVFVQGSYAFVAAWENGLRVVDISNPALPVRWASWKR